jgi:hypothetical protein
MGNATAETLYRIAGRKAAEGYGWDALNAQMAADALLITEEMEKTPRALLDISPLRTLELAEAGLSGVARAFRRQLLKGLDSWGISGTVGATLPEIALADAPLDPSGAGSFAAGWLSGRDLVTFASAEKVRASRLATLADRLYATGEYLAAARSGQAADKATVAAHYGAEAVAVGDIQLASLRTGMLLAEDTLATEGAPEDIAEAGRQARRAHDAANLTDKPIHWETISYLF